MVLTLNNLIVQQVGTHSNLYIEMVSLYRVRQSFGGNIRYMTSTYALC